VALIVISALGWARRHKRDFDAVISIEDPDAKNGLRFHHNPHPDHVLLRFVDLDRPLPSPHCNLPKFRLAQQEHVAAALALARRNIDKKLLVHCHAGVSRSTAIALAIIAERFGAGREIQALQEILRLRPEAVPNLHVVALADALLKCNGRLLAAVKGWDVTQYDNLLRRRQQRQAYFLYYGLPRTSEPELFAGYSF